MGRRKSRKIPEKKPKPKVATIFDCPLCNHEQTVECTLYKKKKIGEVVCTVCGGKHQLRINYLSAAIDIYSDWIDYLEENKNLEEEGEEYDEEDEEDDII
eukprot:TRINITY_DN2009_c0_g1_i1.p1 TRINITY_DN2009_c0_g1~~TRINITY_DN2009_c0_g1_i1.p1  ORF type:complete len:115 (+),score=18.76 TRINITY_DN2009_c0_g1_i1:48-347(+)